MTRPPFDLFIRPRFSPHNPEPCRPCLCDLSYRQKHRLTQAHKCARAHTHTHTHTHRHTLNTQPSSPSAEQTQSQHSVRDAISITHIIKHTTCSYFWQHRGG